MCAAAAGGGHGLTALSSASCPPRIPTASFRLPNASNSRASAPRPASPHLSRELTRGRVSMTVRRRRSAINAVTSMRIREAEEGEEGAWELSSVLTYARALGCAAWPLGVMRSARLSRKV